MITRFSVAKLNRISRKKAIWCIGCGKRLNEMLEMYSEEQFVSCIAQLIDNNSALWGTSKIISGREVTVSGVDVFEEVHNQILLIITSDHFEDIYSGISAIIDQRRIECVAYPSYYSAKSEYLMLACTKLPIKNKLLFYAGREPHENADEIVRYLNMSSTKSKYKIVYITDLKDTADGKIFIDKNALRKKVNIFCIIRYCYHFATSKFLFYENEPIYRVRDSQRLIYLNHGTIPLKRVNDVLKQPNAIDYATCPSEGCSKIYEEQYGIPKEKQIYMMPARTNALFRREKDLSWLTEDRNIIMWLPTFRQLEGTDRKDSMNLNPLEIVGSEMEWLELNKKLIECNTLLVIKNHPREKNKIQAVSLCSNIRILLDEELKNKGVTLEEVLAVTKALLTDYSGIAFEYMLLDRPIGYVIPDMEEYTRGFAVKNPLKYMPGFKIRNYKGLLEFVTDVYDGKETYGLERKRLVEELFQDKAYLDGADLLIKFIESEEM